MHTATLVRLGALSCREQVGALRLLAMQLPRQQSAPSKRGI
jgi:hypothetical protein